MKKFIVSLCIIILLTGTLYTQDGTQTLQETEISEEDLPIGEVDQDAAENGGELEVPSAPVIGIWDVIRMVVSLAVVVGAIYGLYFILKRFGGNKVTENDVITILDSKVIASNKSVHIIEAAGQYYLVGTADNGINVIDKIENKEAIDRLSLIKSSANTTRRSFTDMIKSFFPGKQWDGSKKEGDTQGAGSSVEFLKKQRNKLENL